MLKTALNTNIIPHIWKLVNIVPIPKPNKDITANVPNKPTQHGYKTQHSTVTALHTVNNTVAKRLNQMAPPVRTTTVTLDMSNAFDTLNIHTLFRKLLHTNIPGTIIKFIENYMKRRKAYTTYINHTSSQRQFKVASFLQHTTAQSTGSGHGLRRWHHHTIYTHKHECSQEKHTTISTYSFCMNKRKQNILALNPDKTTCTLFTPDHTEY